MNVLSKFQSRKWSIGSQPSLDSLSRVDWTENSPSFDNEQIKNKEGYQCDKVNNLRIWFYASFNKARGKFKKKFRPYSSRETKMSVEQGHIFVKWKIGKDWWSKHWLIVQQMIKFLASELSSWLTMHILTRQLVVTLNWYSSAEIINWGVCESWP